MGPRGASSGPRLGVTVSRKVGGAVVRNRVKRTLREWFRRTRSQLPDGTDWVVIARSAAAGVPSAELVEELDRTLGIAERCHG
jgi:ribonuclease P protein component